ncbi:MAG: DUF3826 domain-containing protein [Chitinophagaceae bacterium]|nr:DUF3826 domain-containing protein [Chitinophagaceae bacterium]
MKETLLAKKELLHKEVLPAPATRTFALSFFNLNFIVRVLLLTSAAFFCLQVFAQPGDVRQKEIEYKKTLTERSAKIVNTLGITDSGVFDKVVNELVNQYIQLNAIHEQSKNVIADLKSQSLSADEKTASVKGQEEKKSSQLLQLHEQFIAQLKKNLNEEQVDKVKDGMTYKVFPITYAAYQDMLPGLTSAQKEKIYNWLKEARELAMDEGSSDDKHKMFGKYKGRINNYLSAEGYDLKKETAAWQQRIKDREAAKKQTMQ